MIKFLAGAGVGLIGGALIYRFYANTISPLITTATQLTTTQAQQAWNQYNQGQYANQGQSWQQQQNRYQAGY